MYGAIPLTDDILVRARLLEFVRHRIARLTPFLHTTRPLRRTRIQRYVVDMLVRILCICFEDGDYGASRKELWRQTLTRLEEFVNFQASRYAACVRYVSVQQLVDVLQRCEHWLMTGEVAPAQIFAVEIDDDSA